MKARSYGGMTFFILLTATILLAVQTVHASGDLRAAVQNPVGAMYSLPLKLTLDFGAPNGSAYFINVNPVIPVTVGDWNLINRAIIPAIVSVDGFIEGTPEFLKACRPRTAKPAWAILTILCFYRRPSLRGLSGVLGPRSTCPRPGTTNWDPANGVLGPRAWCWSSLNGERMGAWRASSGHLQGMITGPVSANSC